MSLSNDLQILLFDRLSGGGFTVYDPPPATAMGAYVSFGPSYDAPADAACIDARSFTVQLDIWSDAQDGQREAKDMLDRCHDLLHRFSPGAPFGPIFVSLTRVLRDPDNVWHGIMQIEVTGERPPI